VICARAAISFECMLRNAGITSVVLLVLQQNLE